MRSIFITVALIALSLSACQRPQPGPDKTAGGGLLGAGWGAGAGAVVGHQLGYLGQGAGLGAGFGLLSGALIGSGFDSLEATQIEHDNELASLRSINTSNRAQLAQIQYDLDRAVDTDISGGVYQVYFDSDVTSLTAGATANLEVIAETIRKSPRAYTVHVVGHTDDSGNTDYNKKLAEARARSVSAYLASRGISSDQIKISSHASKRPLATNGTPEGRQLNRRVDVYISSHRLG